MYQYLHLKPFTESSLLKSRGFKPIGGNKAVIECFENIFIDLLKNRKGIFEKQEQQSKIQLQEIESKIDNYIERIGETSNLKLIKNYEGKIEILENEKEIIIEKTTKKNLQLKNVGTLLKAKLKKVTNALSIWNTQNLENKKELLKMMFPSGIPINKKRGVGTP